MKPKDAARIACRVLAIYVVVLALDALSSQLRFVQMSFLGASRSGFGLGLGLATGTIPYLAFIGVAVLLWFKADTVGRWMLAGQVPAETETDADTDGETLTRDIETAAFAAIGVYMTARSIPLLFHHFLGVFLPGSEAPELVRGLTTTVQLVLGLVLIFGARELARLIPTVAHRLRSAGHTHSVTEEDE